MAENLDYEKALEKIFQINREYSKQLNQIGWDYYKQLTDIHCRFYLQFFVVYLTVGVTISIAVITEKINLFFIIPAIISFIISVYYIFKLRSLPDELESSREKIIKDLEKNTADDIDATMNLIKDKNNENNIGDNKNVITTPKKKN